MATIPIKRGYLQTFAVTFLNQTIAELRMKVTIPGGNSMTITTTGSVGQVLALTSVTDGRGTHTRATVTLPPAASRSLESGAWNTVEIERMPTQEYLGEFTIEGSAGLNDD
jgi:hypothetical protein